MTWLDQIYRDGVLRLDALEALTVHAQQVIEACDGADLPAGVLETVSQLDNALADVDMTTYGSHTLLITPGTLTDIRRQIVDGAGLDPQDYKTGWNLARQVRDRGSAILQLSRYTDLIIVMRD